MKRKMFLVGFLGVMLALGLALTGCDLGEKCNVGCYAKGTSLNKSRKTCNKSDCAIEKAQFSTYDPINVSCDC
ncbi:hypothetical protein FACS189462_1850 [Spirochaetia bacterium]|nr:hypothetical protein FACS189462_1850 [Spirochaetia bacterium]